jgi:hypothetical protein
MERKLATVRKVTGIKPIAGADQIECVVIDGWEVVSRKDNNFKVGDEVIYIEIDSIVPAIPYFEFMKQRNYRVRTIKLKGQVSQGLIIPVIDKEKIHQQLGTKSTLSKDLDEYIGITKYIAPEDREVDVVSSNKKDNVLTKYLKRFAWFRKMVKPKSQGGFPTWISKTDEERVQNIPNVLTENPKTRFYVTEKLDGQSATYWYKKGWFKDEFGICSRAVRKHIGDGSNWSVVAKGLNIKDKLKQAYKEYGNLVIQGEIIGPSIQGNPYKLKDKQLFLFNVYAIDKKKYFDEYDINLFAHDYGFNVVPLLDRDYYLPPTVEEVVKYASGKSVLNPAVNREGVVIRTPKKTISFKAISNEYLLKKEQS